MRLAGLLLCGVGEIYAHSHSNPSPAILPLLRSFFQRHRQLIALLDGMTAPGEAIRHRPSLDEVSVSQSLRRTELSCRTLRQAMYAIDAPYALGTGANFGPHFLAPLVAQVHIASLDSWLLVSHDPATNAALVRGIADKLLWQDADPLASALLRSDIPLLKALGAAYVIRAADADFEQAFNKLVENGIAPGDAAWMGGGAVENRRSSQVSGGICRPSAAAARTRGADS
jgi:hypothetical protein